MQRILSVLLFMAMAQTSIAYSDTSWLDQKWKKTDKVNASYYSLSTKKEQLWEQRIFYSDSRQLFMQGCFTDSLLETRTGLFRWYFKTGGISDSIIYRNNVGISVYHFHSNGQVKTKLLRDSVNMPVFVNSWDGSGNESYRDTFYTDRFGRDCHKDTSMFKSIIYKEGDAWRLQSYFTSNDTLFAIAYFKERLCKTRIKYTLWYGNGHIRDSMLFGDNGKKTALWSFHANGNKNAFRSFDENGKRIIGRNWDEDGKEIKLDTSFNYAVPEMGYKKWQRTVLRKINNDKSIDSKYRKDLYGSVYISFYVDESGKLVEAFIKEHSLYRDMDALILQICSEEKQWKPAKIHGRTERFAGTHSFSFVAGKVIKYQSMY